jgi:hypothetical protein
MINAMGIREAVDECAHARCRPSEDDALRLDPDYQAWLDERVAAAIAVQDDAELMARRWGPEPEFMLCAVGAG